MMNISFPPRIQALGEWLIGVLVFVLLTSFMIECYSPLFHGHDSFFHIERIRGMAQAIADGNLPWYVNYNGFNGAGYLVKAFYSDVILFPIALVAYFTDLHTSYQFYIFAFTLLTCLSMDYAVFSITRSRLAGVLSAVVFAFCNYRLLDIYVRGSLGEVLAFTFLPIVVLGCYQIVKGDYRKWYILAIGYALTIFSHTLSSVMLLPVIILFVVCNLRSMLREPKRFLMFVYAGLATLLLTACYVLPLIEQNLSNTFYYQMQEGIIPETIQGTFSISFVLDSLLLGSTYFQSPIALSIGILLIIPLLGRLFISQRTSLVRFADQCLLLGTISLFILLDFVSWSVFPLNMLNVVQFPWRFLLFVSFFWAVAGGIYLVVLLDLAKANRRHYLAVLLVISIIAGVSIRSAGRNFTYISSEANKTIVGQETDDARREMHYHSAEYLPSRIPSREYVISETQRLSQLYNRTIDKGVLTFDISSVRNQARIELPVIYYKGYTAHAAGTEVAVEQSANGFVQLAHTDGDRVEIYYAGTWLQALGLWISALSTVCLIAYIFRRKDSDNPSRTL